MLFDRCGSSWSSLLKYLAINNDVWRPTGVDLILGLYGDDVQLTRGYFRREEGGKVSQHLGWPWLPGQVDDEIDVHSDKFFSIFVIE